MSLHLKRGEKYCRRVMTSLLLMSSFIETAQVTF